MFVTGPGVVRAVTPRDVDAERLGGATTHTTRQAASPLRGSRRGDRPWILARRLLGHLPQNNSTTHRAGRRRIRVTGATPHSTRSCPDDPQKPYDMHRVIDAIVDDADFLEASRAWAQNIIVGFGRLDGRTVGIVAQQPAVLAGALDIDASTKAARSFAPATASTFRLSRSSMYPGSCPAWARNTAGSFRHGAKLLFAYCEATVPKVTVITRKAYGGAYDVMSSKHVRADMNFAWPTAEIAVMGARRRGQRDLQGPHRGGRGSRRGTRAPRCRL